MQANSIQPPKADLHALGFVRVGVASPAVKVADVPHNTDACIAALRALAQGGANIAVLPELALTAYTCGDLFYQDTLLSAAEKGLKKLLKATAHLPLLAAVGLPVFAEGRLFNVAAVFSRGKLLGVVPKSFLPNAQEFYEQRWFSPAQKWRAPTVRLAGQEAPVGADLLFAIEDLPHTVVGVEICEDLWAVEPPSGKLALAGANVLLNLSASNEVLGKPLYRAALVTGQSARCLAAYAYANAGAGESTTDLVYSGHSLIAENGALLAQTGRFSFDLDTALADVDIDFLNAERRRHSSFAQAGAPQTGKSAVQKAPAYRTVFAKLGVVAKKRALARRVEAAPFVPADDAAREAHCDEVFALQASALAARLRHTRAKGLVLGLSGGLDSTLALLVAVRALDAVGVPRAGLTAITMPGFGTTARTQRNAETLAQSLGATLRVIPIAQSVLKHFEDIGHDRYTHDVTYENAQARERTQILMDVANKEAKLCLGTGDLSEAALGWCTFNGDHMSMYHVNAGVPKTLVQHVIRWAALHRFDEATRAVLADVLDTPITPELLPAGDDGAIVQETESIIGPYALHDFFLFYAVRRAASPAKILFLAQSAFGARFSRSKILDTLEIFCRRFFAHQFKRSAMPDTPKIGSVALSPRGDWRMPSDASPTLWLSQIAQLRTSR